MRNSLQLARRLTPESREALNDWQRQYLPNIGSNVTLNENPTIAVLNKRLVQQILFEGPAKGGLVTPAVSSPVSMEPLGMKVRPPIYKKRSLINLTFDEPREFIQQRVELLEKNGAAEEAKGFYNPILHVATVSALDLSLEALAECVRNRPAALTFLPVDLEDTSPSSRR